VTAAERIVLLVDDDPLTLTHFQAALSSEASLRVLTAVNGVEGLQLARKIQPDLIISDYRMPEMDGFEFCRQIRSDPDLASCMFVVLSGFSDTVLKVRGLDIGVDDYLTKPIEVPELLARVRAALRIKALQDELRRDRDQIETLHGELGRSFEQLLQLLIHLVDLGLPGAAERGRRVRLLASRIAARFEIPAELLPDLELAAQLHEIGRVVDAAHQQGGGVYPDWHYAVVSRTLLDQVERLQGAGELIGGIYENWDGTGMPNHLVSGQIPLRSRVLRAAIDFDRLVSGETGHRRSPAQAIEELGDQMGTRYDPLAIRHLESVVLDRPREEWEATRAQVAVDQLAEGMVLAADLCTSSGIKLLAKGTTISRSMLEVIDRRNQADPILDGVWVSRR
jgi:response regulator RpfG family c-di-GMP phosphodiesterase